MKKMKIDKDESLCVRDGAGKDILQERKIFLILT